MMRSHLDNQSPAAFSFLGSWFAAITCVSLMALAGSGHAAPGDVLFEDDFESGFGQWGTTNSNLSGINSMTAATSNSLFVRGGTVNTTSIAIDTRVPSLRIVAWIRRGADAFSEDPDTGDDLRIEYLDAGGSWELIQSYLGSGTNGEIIALDRTLSGDALHAGFRLRVRLTNGSGGPPANRRIGWDYWHIDDLQLSEIGAAVALGVGRCEEFESGLAGWTVTGSPGNATTTSQTANTPSRSLAIFGGRAAVTSDPVNTSNAMNLGASLWIRRGADSFSEDPDRGEDLFVEYLDSSGSWSTLGRYWGNGSPGQIYTPSFSLPAGAVHTNFRMRLRMTGNDGSPWDYWHVDSICLTGTPLPSAEWRFDEASWDGVAQEVLDSSGNGNHGSTASGPTTASADPALAGDPGTCSYGDFTGDEDGVRIAHDDDLSGTDALTYLAWIQPTDLGGKGVIMGKEYKDQDTAAQMALIRDKKKLSAEIETVDGEEKLKTGNVFAADVWYHVALVFDGTSALLYVDGVLEATETFSATTLVEDTRPFAIGMRAGNDPDKDNFTGYLDEVRIYKAALDQAAIAAIGAETHPCPIAGDLLVTHDGNAIYCQAESVGVTARDGSGATRTGFTETITLDTQVGRGSWSLLSGSGNLVDAPADDGRATYAFDPADLGQAEFLLDYGGSAASIDIDVSAGAIVDDDSEGNLVYAPGAFTVTANALPDPPPATINDPVGTQTAGVPFEIHLAAYGASCGVVDSYAGPKPIQLWLERNDPALGTIVPTIDLAPIADSEAGSSSQTVQFTNGRAMVLAKYKDVGRITIRAKDASAATPIAGSTGAFVVRPNDFVITSILNASNVANPGLTTPTGTHWARAGESFTITAEARDAENSLTPSYGRESTAEGLRVVSTGLVAPVGGRNGTLDDGAIGNATVFTATAPAGTFEGSSFSFDEVGAIRLRVGVADGDYLGTGDVVGTESGDVGRFAPFAFEVTANAPRFETGCTLGAFTWIGQPFDYVSGQEAVMTVRAVNVAGSTTANYSGDWFLLTNATLDNRTYAVGGSTLDETGLPLTTDDPVIDPNGDGTGTLTFGTDTGLSILRSAPVVPFYAEIELGIDIIDADDTRYAANPFTIGGTTTGTGIDFDASKRFQYGRVAIENAHGSELVDLPFRLRTQRFTGITFADDTNDSCTQIPASALILSPSPASLASTPSIANEPVSGGDTGLVMSAPGSVGIIDLRVDLGTTGANIPWLRYDWPEDGNLDGLVDDDPRGRATFGIWQGRDNLIFTREVY